MYTFKLLLSTIGIIGAVLAPAPARCSSPPIKEGQFYLTTADGVSIFVRHKYTTRAHKVPVLLVHGTWGNSQTWDFPGRSVMDYLAVRGYDTYALDMRGMGMSARPASYYTIGLPSGSATSRPLQPTFCQPQADSRSSSGIVRARG